MSDTTNKAERLASAVYLLTSFFGDQEPLKWRLRTLVSELVSYSNALRDNLYPEAGTKLKADMVSREAVSLIKVSKNAGLISDANYDLISQEFSKYVDFLAVRQEVSGLLSEPEAREKPVEEKPLTRPVIKDKISEPVRESSAGTEYLPSYTAPEPSQNIHDRAGLPDQVAPRPGKSAPERRTQLKEFGAVSVKKNARQSAIISLLKRKKEIMIKDVSPLISDCSEKTIQRELLSMVKAGILTKSGEKRWSRYSLA
jgi:hypothetical protein